MNTMHRAIWGALLGALTAASGCSSAQCGAPPTTTYACELLPPGSRGCSMDPGTVFGMSVGPPPGGAVAPIGCTVTLPYCHPFYANSTADCTCMAGLASDAGSAGEGSWVCPL